MPELPEMQALSERVGAAVLGHRLLAYQPLGFASLKTVRPSPDELVGLAVTAVERRGKFLVTTFETGLRLLIHLAQAGRLDVESPPKVTRPRGAIVRLVFSDDLALLVREHGHERHAGWWVLAPGDEGPLAALGPEASEEDFAALIRTSDDKRRIHTVLRDQHFGAGIGRGYADDVLNRAKLSPFSPLRSLTQGEREELLSAIEAVLAEALAHERERGGGLSAARLGDRFAVHNRFGQPCPRCGDTLQRVSYESYEIVYCPRCQTHGRVYADRRLSRLLR